MRALELKIKYILDRIFSLILIVILFPLLIISSLFIGIESRGGVVFKQKRLGEHGKEFTIYKFRTMVDKAEYFGDGLIIKDGNDCRITKVGKILRRMSLDELPQLFNVLKGDMSFIGPRPPVVYHPYDGYVNYSDFAKKRFEMRPGITGLAQVRMRNSATWDERIKVDVEYIDNFSLLLDIKILFLTIFSLFNKEEFTS